MPPGRHRAPRRWHGGPARSAATAASGSAEQPTRYGDVLRVAEFRAMFLAQSLSIVGDQIARIALALLVFDRTGSPLAAAATFALSYLPYVVLGPALASYADRLPRRQVMIVCDLARGALVLPLALPGMPLPVLLVLLFAVALLTPPFESARAATIPDVLPGDLYVAGSALTNLMAQSGFLLGYLFGGALVGLLGVHGALLLDAATFLVSALVLRARLQHRPAANEATGRGISRVLRDTREGVRIVFADHRLRSYMLLGWAGAAFTVVPEGLAVPLVSRSGGGELAAGVLTAALPLGAVLGNLAYSRFFPPTRRLELMHPLAGFAMVPLIVSVVTDNLIVSFVLWTLSGVGTAFQLAANAGFVAEVPPAVRSRAFSVAAGGMMVVQALILLVAGAAAERFAVPVVVAASGGAGLVSVWLLWQRRPVSYARVSELQPEALSSAAA